MVARMEQPFLDAIIVLDHAVVHDGDAPAFIKMGMRILVRRRAVRGPSGMANACVAFQGLGLQDLRELPIQVPSLGEQRLRVARLRRTEDAVLAAKQAAARQIDLMLERRQALITAAVTGQLEIPGVAA